MAFCFSSTAPRNMAGVQSIWVRIVHQPGPDKTTNTFRMGSNRASPHDSLEQAAGHFTLTAATTNAAKQPSKHQRANAGRHSRPQLHGSWDHRGGRATRTAGLPRVPQLVGMEKSLNDAAPFHARPVLSK
jgi:hypothetical protein